MATFAGKSKGGDEVELSPEQLFDVLSSRRRRYLIHALSCASMPVALGALAEQVAAWEYDTAVDDLTESQRRRVYTSLQQSHIPRLEEMGVVTVDRTRGEVCAVDGIESYDVYFNVVTADTVPWSQFYLGLAAVAGALLVTAAAGLPPVSEVGVLGWTGVTVAAFAASALVQAGSDTRLLETDGDPPDLEL